MPSLPRVPLPAVAHLSIRSILITLLYPSLVHSHSLLTHPTLSTRDTSLTLAIPLAAQLPPLARPATPYAFALAPSTFAFSNSSPVAYASDSLLTASGLPHWLAFDERALLFSGTPSGDAQPGQWNVSLAGPGANSAFQLFLSTDAVPTVTDGLDTQLSAGSASLANATALSDASGVLVPPSTTFELSFAADIWGSPPNGETWSFAALQAPTNLPLPSWLSLSTPSSASASITFSGTSPSTPTSLLLSLSLLSSAYPGSSLASTHFSLQVGTSASGIELANGPGLGEIRTTVRDRVRYFFWPQGVSAGGQAVQPGDVQAEWDLSGVPWLSYDATSRYLTGTTPDAFLSGTSTPLLIPLNLTLPSSPLSPPLATYLPLHVLPYAFTALTIPAVNLTTPTSPVNASFSPYLSNPGSTSLWMEAFFNPSDAGAWLALDPTQTALIGSPPANASYASVSVGLLAWDESTNLTSTASLAINLQPPTTTTSPTSTTTPTPTSTPHDSVSTGLSTPARNTLIAVLACVAALTLLFFLLFCICRRRRQRRQQQMVREKGIGKPIRPMTFDPEAVAAAAEAGYILAPEVHVQLPPQAVTSAGSSPTLFVTSPVSGSEGHGYGKDAEKVKGYGEYVLVDLPRSPPRAHTPIEQLRAQYPHAFTAQETSPPSTAGMATDESAGLGLGRPRVELDERAMREKWGVTASGSEQVRMIDRAVVQAAASTPPSANANGKGKGKEARRSRLMDFFGTGAGGFFAARGNHHGELAEEESVGVPDVARQLSVGGEGDVWEGREYDAFGRLVRRGDGEGEDAWGAGSEPRALFSHANAPIDMMDDSGMGYATYGEENPFGSGVTATSLGLDGSHGALFTSDSDLAFSHSSASDGEAEDYSEESFPFDSNGSSEGEVVQVQRAEVIRLPSVTAEERERWRATNHPNASRSAVELGTPRVVYAGERWTPPPTTQGVDGLPLPGSAETLASLGYPVAAFSFGDAQNSSSISVRLIQPAPPGPVLSPASASAARLDMSAFPTSTPARAVGPPPRMDLPPAPAVPPIPASYSKQQPQRPSHRRRPTSASSSPTLQPYRFLARPGEAFHFNPVLNPPPPVIPTSSRNSSIIRPSYVLQPDPESDERTTSVPAWLHWDQAELKLFGQPAREDALRAFGVRILERTVIPPGSPTKGRSPAGSVEEQVVSRLVIEVAAPTR